MRQKVNNSILLNNCYITKYFVAELHCMKIKEINMKRQEPAKLHNYDITAPKSEFKKNMKGNFE